MVMHRLANFKDYVLSVKVIFNNNYKKDTPPPKKTTTMLKGYDQR
jgi:hypothetical protein